MPSRKVQPPSYQFINNQPTTNTFNAITTDNKLSRIQPFEQQRESNNFKAPMTIKLRHNNSSSSTSNRTHINQHFYIKNKLYNLTDQNSKHFFDKAAHAKETNRFEDFYDNFFPEAYPPQGNSKKIDFHFLKNGDLVEKKRRTSHLFSL